MKRLLISLLAVLAVCTHVTAQHTLDSLKMTVTLHRDGSAEVQEFRSMHIGNEGTECFIKMYNLGDMDVSDLSVYEDTIKYINEGAWDVERSRSQKAFRCGIHETFEGKELCWGVGSSGYHEYVVCYTLHGLVKGYSDYDGFNFCFYEAANPPALKARITYLLEPGDFTVLQVQDADTVRRIPIELDRVRVDNGDLLIYSKEDTTEIELRYPMNDDGSVAVDSETLRSDNAGIWAFGFYGLIEFRDNVVVAETDMSMSEGEKMIVMMRFAKDLFEPEYNYPDKSFETDIREPAFEGSDYTLDDEGEGSMASLAGGDVTPAWVDVLLMVLGGFCCFGAPLLLILAVIFGKRNERKQVRKLLEGMPEYYHEPPLNGNLIRSRRILRALEPSADKSEMKLVEAYVLRLVDRKLISVTSEMDEKGEMVSLFRIQEPQTASTVLGEKSEESTLLFQLLRILYIAAGEDHLLQPKELKQMVKDDPLTVREFARKLRDLNDLQLRVKQIKKEDAQQVYGFWKYLKDFTLVKERALQEVALWKEYLTFATLFGIADQVRADMKKIAPDLQVFDALTRHIIEETTSQSALYSALTSSIIDAATRTINYETDSERLARLARERAERRQRWSGGGGRVSFGGGGGFSGGGGSGVR